MKCPLCGFHDSKVIDSRPVEGNDSIRRRRECLSCHRRFTTYELVEAFQPLVIKKDGSAQMYKGREATPQCIFGDTIPSPASDTYYLTPTGRVYFTAR